MAAPFHVGDGDAAGRSVADGVENLWRGEGGHVAGPLDFLFVHVHRLGHVDGKHKLHVDLPVGIVAVAETRLGRAGKAGGGEQGGTGKRHQDMACKVIQAGRGRSPVRAGVGNIAHGRTPSTDLKGSRLV